MLRFRWACFYFIGLVVIGLCLLMLAVAGWSIWNASLAGIWVCYSSLPVIFILTMLAAKIEPDRETPAGREAIND